MALALTFSNIFFSLAFLCASSFNLASARAFAKAAAFSFAINTLAACYANLTATSTFLSRRLAVSRCLEDFFYNFKAAYLFLSRRFMTFICFLIALNYLYLSLILVLRSRFWATCCFLIALLAALAFFLVAACAFAMTALVFFLRCLRAFFCSLALK